MNAVEMQHSLESKIRGLNIEEIFFDTYRSQKLLNEAQDKFVDKYAPLYDTSEEARKKLDVLVKHAAPTISAAGASNLINGYFVTLPTDTRWILMELATTSTAVLKVKPIKYDSYLIEKDNPFKKPDSSLVWRIDYGAGSLQHELITDGVVTLTEYKIRYISNPSAIDLFANTSCSLLAKDHEEIVNIALSLLNIKQNE